MSAAIPYVDKCVQDARDGFQSQARPAQAKGCAPGTIPPRCKAARRITGTIPAASSVIIAVGGFQPAQPLAIVDLGSDVEVTIDDLKVNKQSLFYKLEGKDTVSDAAIVDGLGAIVDLGNDFPRSGTNPFPTAPLVDQNNPLRIEMSNSAAADRVFDFFLYFGNPAEG